MSLDLRDLADAALDVCTDDPEEFSQGELSFPESQEYQPFYSRTHSPASCRAWRISSSPAAREMMSMPIAADRDERPADHGHAATCTCARCHPSRNQGVCADAIATLEGISREAVDELAAGQPAPRRRSPSRKAASTSRLVPVLPRRRLACARPRGISAPADDGGRPGRAEAVVRGAGRLSARRQGHDLPRPDPAEVTRPEDRARPPRRQFLGRGGRRRRAAAGLARTTPRHTA